MTMDETDAAARYRVGDLQVDTGSRRVLRGNRRLKLGGLTFDLLLALIESSPSYLSYDQLAARVWHGRAVTPETIAQRAKMLRDALGDDAKAPRYLELIRGEGYRLVAEVERLSDAPRSELPRRGAMAVVGAAFGMLLLIYLGTVLLRDESPPSVAVLPFTDMSPDGDHRYLADGMAEELIHALTRLQDLEVASRTDAFAFRDDAGDIQRIGRELRVTSVLEGSVRRSGEDLRVTVQLIDVDSGYHLWSGSFDRPVDNIFAIQEEIARSVAGALGVTLGVGGVNDFPGAGTNNFAAYEAFLQGEFRKAIELDPNYASAWGLRGLMIASTMFNHPPEDAPPIIEEAYRHVSRAIELDPSSARAHADFATIIYGNLQSSRLDWQRAHESFMKSLSIQRDPYNLGHFGNMLMRAGRSSDALRIYEEGTAMLVLEGTPSMHRVNVDIALKRLGQAREKARRMPEKESAHMMLAIAFNDASVDGLRAAIDALPEDSDSYRFLYSQIVDKLDRPDAVAEFLQTLVDDNDRLWPEKYEQAALVAAWAGFPELAFDIFHRELKYTPIRIGTLWFPVMSGVRGLPEFHEFVEDANLVQFWRTTRWSDFCRPLGDEDFICE